MSKRGEQNWLLLTVKSLSPNRDSKHYQLLIKNHAIDNQLTIQNQFSHNYEYVYKLWPCRPAERELIKIDMFEVLKEKGKDIFVKRGQASPLVHYTSQGERFQFYASSEQKSVLILKFRTENQEKIENQTSKDRLNIINKNMWRELQSNRYESEEYAKYLDYTNQFVDDLSKGSIEKQKISLKPISQQIQKDKLSRLTSQAQSALTKQLNTSRNNFKIRDKGIKADNFLNNSKYLNKDIELPSKSQMNERSHRQANRAKTEAGSSINDLEESIRKRRQLYLCNRVETIAQKPSQSPILSAYKSDEEEPMKFFTSEKPHLHNQTIENETQTDRLEVIRMQKERVKSECLSTPESYKPGIIRIDSQLSKNSNQSSKKGREREQKQKKQDQIVRTSNFPIQNANYLSLSRRFGTIRRKKLESLYSSPDLLEQIARPSRERSITHVSRSSKIYPTQKERYFDLEISNFKATLYRPKGRCFRKLVLLFEESRYATESVQCLHLTAGWNQKFGIRNCKESSYLYCRLYCSCQNEEEQEGEATINLQEAIQSKQKIFKVLFISQELAIGYLQFQLSKTDCTSLVSRADLGDSKDGGLPKSKKDSLPKGIKGISAKKTSLPLQMRKSIQSSSSPKESVPSRSKSRRRFLQLREVNALAGGEGSVVRAIKPESSGMSKIREKKLKMRSKLK